MAETHEFVPAFMLSVLAGSARPSKRISERQDALRQMKKDSMAELIDMNPFLNCQINDSAGYAVFSNVRFNLLRPPSGQAYGILTENHNGRDTFMKMGEVDFGIGASDFRMVMVFHTPKALAFFNQTGLAFGSQWNNVGEMGPVDVSMIQLKETGFALRAMIMSANYWKDEELNQV